MCLPSGSLGIWAKGKKYLSVPIEKSSEKTDWEKKKPEI